MFNAIVAIFESGIVWQIGFFVMAGYIIIEIGRMQRDDVRFDLLQLFQDPDTKLLDPIRTSYSVSLIVTTVGYVYIFMTVKMTPGDFAAMTGAYAGIWVVGQGANKLISRPQQPQGTTVVANTANVNPTPEQQQ